jgi:CheY-like chemotaxis protein
MPFVILLVEDDVDVREALAEALEDEGFEIHRAGDGQEALDYLNAGGRPGLILLDLSMPRMSGVEFRRAQQQDPAIAGLPVVVLSADSRMRESATALDAAGAVEKPIDLDLLLSVIERIGGLGAASAAQRA